MAAISRIATATVGSALLAAGLLTAGPAQAATPDTGSDVHILNCYVKMNKPTRSGHRVTGVIRTFGCGSGVKWHAKLQSSRWWGWAVDAEQTWYGSQTRRLRAACAGIHDHRLIVEAIADGQGSGYQAGPKARLNCG